MVIQGGHPTAHGKLHGFPGRDIREGFYLVGWHHEYLACDGVSVRYIHRHVAFQAEGAYIRLGDEAHFPYIHTIDLDKYRMVELLLLPDKSVKNVFDR